jgi:hypothetical protein
MCVKEFEKGRKGGRLRNRRRMKQEQRKKIMDS